LNKTFPTRFENENLTITQIKIVDKQKKPKFGDSIEVRIYRRPLFGLREEHVILNTATNKLGIAEIQFSKSNNYTLSIKTRENKLDFFEIDSKDLINGKKFVIEE
jgi:hypothetical protein